MIPSAIGTGLVFHQVSIIGEAGLGPEVAASVLSLMAVVRLPVVFFAGHIADRLPVRYLLAVGLGLLFLGIVVQLNISSVQTAMAYGALLGVMMAFLSIVGGVIWPEYFGRRYLGGIRGVAMMAMVAGSAAGPLPFGFAYDLFGGYREILVISMFFPVLGMVAAMLATPPRK
ncbi:MAG: MFS transporter [Candidatus Bathyarchaeota archaeon]|nr:MFS transporter [Candidatus Bathyarchaeota archaeon]